MAAGVTNAAPMGGGLRVIAQGRSFSPVSFPEPVKILLATIVSDSGIAQSSATLQPGDSFLMTCSAGLCTVSLASDGQSMNTNTVTAYIALG